MNCKPGDLAMVVYPCEYLGWLVEVLAPAPGYEFMLPNGVPHVACRPGWWVVKSLGSPFTGQRGDGEQYPTHYGAGSDKGLRPIRDTDPADVERAEDFAHA